MIDNLHFDREMMGIHIIMRSVGNNTWHFTLPLTTDITISLHSIHLLEYGIRKYGEKYVRETHIFGEFCVILDISDDDVEIETTVVDWKHQIDSERISIRVEAQLLCLAQL